MLQLDERWAMKRKTKMVRQGLTVYLNRHFLDNGRDHLGALRPTLKPSAEILPRHRANE